ncbi:MAG: STAS domain-containing protein [Phycisphaerales bacterium]|nr:STAS domain-containing protein [Phycisphaerales bacterium]
MSMIDNSRVHTEFADGVVVATIRLEKVTDADITALQTDLTAAARPHAFRLAIDFSQVLLLGSCGISLLLLLRKEAAAAGGKVAIFGLSGDLLGMLKKTGLISVLSPHKSRNAAVEACR